MCVWGEGQNWRQEISFWNFLIFKVTGDLYDIALDESCRRVETVELIVRQGSPSQDGPILFTELFDDNYNLQMDGSDLQKWPELTNYCNSYDIGLRLTGTFLILIGVMLPAY